MKKKIIIIVIAAVLALALIATGAVLLLKGSFKNPFGSNSSELTSVSDESDTNSDNSSPFVNVGTSITVGSVEAAVGEKIKVPVTINDNPGIMAMLLSFKYDTASLKYVGYEKGNILSDYEFSENKDTIKFVSCEDKDISKNGELFYLEFEVLKGAKTSDILLSIGQYDVCNYSETLVYVMPNSGKVTIK